MKAPNTSRADAGGPTLHVLSIGILLSGAGALLGCNRAQADRRSDGAGVTALTPAPLATSAASASTRSPQKCTSGMTLVEAKGTPRFCVDRYEAQLAEQTGSGSIPHSPYERPKPTKRYAAVSKKGVPPQAYVNRIEAAAACKNAGKRLCKAREWYAACAGSFGNKYPYGNKYKETTCNVNKGHLLRKVFGRVPYTKHDHYNSPRMNQTPGFLAKTAEYSDCVSGVGAYDMVGNLHEWVADDVSAKLAKELPLEKGNHWLGRRGMGVFMGGYFSSRGEHGRGCLYVTATHAPDYHDYSTGFRCCSDPKP